MVIEEARKLSSNQRNKNIIDDDFCDTVYECELLVNQFLKIKQINKKDIMDVHNNVLMIGKNCQEKFYNLGYKITKSLIQQVADDFLDINHPVRKLADVVMSPQG